MKIRNILAEYAQNRDNNTYFKTMKRIADDFREGIVTQDYPAFIANDSDSKAFYGAILIVIKKELEIKINVATEEMVGNYAEKIKYSIMQNTKRDWKQNEMVHKAIHKVLDDYIFEMFDEMNIVIDKSNVETIDLLIEEIMKVAVARY